MQSGRRATMRAKPLHDVTRRYMSKDRYRHDAGGRIRARCRAFLRPITARPPPLQSSCKASRSQKTPLQSSESTHTCLDGATSPWVQLASCMPHAASWLHHLYARGASWPPSRISDMHYNPHATPSLRLSCHFLPFTPVQPFSAGVRLGCRLFPRARLVSISPLLRSCRSVFPIAISHDTLSGCSDASYRPLRVLQCARLRNWRPARSALGDLRSDPMFSRGHLGATAEACRCAAPRRSWRWSSRRVGRCAWRAGASRRRPPPTRPRPRSSPAHSLRRSSVARRPRSRRYRAPMSLQCCEPCMELYCLHLLR